MRSRKRLRIGIGYDIHRLSKGRKLILGGVHIPYPKGLAGHSDADVLTHALCDGLLGAIGQGDMGELFPDTDPRFKDISSLKLLKEVMDLLKAKEYAISNIDATIVAQEPRLDPYREQMRETIAKVLEIDQADINLKAKSPEGLGWLGESGGIAVYTVACVQKKGIKG